MCAKPLPCTLVATAVFSERLNLLQRAGVLPERLWCGQRMFLGARRQIVRFNSMICLGGSQGT